MTDQDFPRNVMTDVFTVQYFGKDGTIKETIPYQLIEEDIVDAMFMLAPNSSNFIKDAICNQVLCFYHSPRKRDLSDQTKRIQYAHEMLHLRNILTIQYN
jgi:hypothetical protein